MGVAEVWAALGGEVPKQLPLCFQKLHVILGPNDPI